MKKIGFTLLTIVFAVSCAKWISIDISDESVVLLSPFDDQSDSIQNKTFVWEELEGATQYRLQIVSKSFDSIYDFVLDSAVSNTSFSITLIPNFYEWRLRGENNDFNSLWSTRKLNIKGSASLENQEITINSPSNGLNTNKMSQTFKWNSLISAQDYLITIIDEDNETIKDEKIEETEYSYTFTDEGLYTIEIKALNSISASITSSIEIRIDTTMPSDVTLKFPLSDDTLKSFPKTFTWTEDSSNTGSPIMDTLCIASDSAMNSLVLDTTFESTTSFTLDTIRATSGKLFWKLKRGDAAGNSNTKMPSKSFHLE
ncbi:MAG: hypothetical protein CMP67_01880 [Flavobacteriales bacterium]|nr:hypothetical protein [Flavobacteriales bacterium]|tara:strand:- start:10416 stop:11357 length:942 start_codon:yes stop_codon:yes gene_type:complete